MTTTDTDPTETATVEVKSYRRRRPAFADSSVSPELARDLKNRGQQLSIEDVDAIDEELFMAVVAAVPAGAKFDANDLRPDLDRAGVPQVRRAGLMNRACARGLCAPIIDVLDGVPTVRKAPSTGRTAKRASVVQYRRAVAAPEGR